MILEGIVTTLDSAGDVNIAPMGPRLSAPYTLDLGSTFELKPFATAHTARNLREHPQGVLHVTDDVLLLAQAAVGVVIPTPALRPALGIRGVFLPEVCRAYEFQVVSRDESSQRLSLHCEVLQVHRLRDFFGFNRAMFAVVEAAILATRTALLPAEEIEAEYRRLRGLIEKTGGPREHEAFAYLQAFVRRAGDRGSE